MLACGAGRTPNSCVCATDAGARNCPEPNVFRELGYINNGERIWAPQCIEYNLLFLLRFSNTEDLVHYSRNGHAVFDGNGGAHIEKATESICSMFRNHFNTIVQDS
jgi:hypothetical protein